MQQIIPFMFCFDKNYAIPAGVAFRSLLENHEKVCIEKNIFLKLYVVHNDIPQTYQEKLLQIVSDFRLFASLEFIYGNNYLKDIWNSFTGKNHFAPEVLYKLIVPKLFPQYDKVIVSDVDTIFTGNVLKEFNDFDVEDDYLIGGVTSNAPELFFPIPKKGYRSGYSKFSMEDQIKIQHGVDGAYLLINVRAWKQNHIEKKAIDILFLYADKLVLAEQDVLALACYPKIKKISNQYALWHGSWNLLGEDFSKMRPNIYSKEEILMAAKHPIQIHFACGAKPWNTPSEPKSDLWFSYLVKTPFLQDFLENLEKMILQKHYKASWKYQFDKLLKNPKILLNLNNYKKCVAKLFG